jgi:hypothetical protein
LIGLSPLPSGHPSGFQPTTVRSSTACYGGFNLPKGRSPRLRVCAHVRNRPIQTRFRYGSGPEGLNLHVSSNSPDHNAKGTPSGIPKNTLRPLVSTRFQDLFHSPPGVLFTFPSRYSCTIGHRGVFRLGGWSPLIHAELPVFRATRDTTRGRTRSTTGLSPSMAGLSRPLRLGVVHPERWSHNPGSACTPGLACSPFAHRY